MDYYVTVRSLNCIRRKEFNDYTSAYNYYRNEALALIELHIHVMDQSRLTLSDEDKSIATIYIDSNI